jgi:hypothetical protein
VKVGCRQYSHQRKRRRKCSRMKTSLGCLIKYESLATNVVLYSKLAWHKLLLKFWKTAPSDSAQLIIYVNLIERLVLKSHSHFSVNNRVEHSNWDNCYEGNWMKTFPKIVCFHLLSWKSNLSLNFNTQW